MPISTYDILTQEIPLPTRGDQPKASFKVRALALPDIEHLVRYHLADLTKAVELYTQQKNGRMASSTLHEFALLISRDVPGLTAEIIHTTLEGEPEPVPLEKIRKLPVLVQISALLAICQLTNEEAGGLKNLIAFVVPLLQGVVAGAGSEPGTLKRKLLDTIGAFVKMPTSSLPTDGE